MQNTHLPHAFVISLPEASHRRERIITRLDEMGFVHSIFNGVDGRKFDVQTHPSYDFKKRMRYFGRDLLGGELGCFLSHKGALEEIVKQNLPYALIFEDDAILQGELIDVATALISGDVPDLVRFIGKNKVYNSTQKIIRILCGDTKLSRLQATPGGAYAYFISNQGAKKLLRYMDKIYLPVDTVMGYSWMTGVDNLVAIPSPVTHDFLEDTHIGDERFDKTIIVTGMQKATYPITRLYFKSYENIMKRLNFHLKSRGNS